MNQRYIVEPRASKDYPWQFVDIACGLTPVGIYKTKRQANRAREAYKREIKRIAAEDARRVERLETEGYFEP